VITERELDARLAAAAGIHDETLPALPESFLQVLREAGGDADETTTGSGQEPASVVAARQLVTDAREARTSARRRPPRPRTRSIALLAIAAAGAAALVVGLTQVGTRTPTDGTATPTATSVPSSTPTVEPSTPPSDLGPLEAPQGGLVLVATQQITFPYSLDPAPAGLTPVLSLYGGISPFGVEPTVWGATYRSANSPGFAFSISSEDPRQGEVGNRPQDARVNEDILETGVVSVGGIEADFVRGDYAQRSCGYGPSTPNQTDEPDQVCSESFLDLFWQRPDGQWVYMWGENEYSQVAALVSVAESIVDRPQPVPLQVGLAPVGWSVSSYGSDGNLTLISDADPSISNRLSISLLERWRGYTKPDLGEMAEGNPVEQVTVDGEPAELVSVPDHFAPPEDQRRMWNLAGQFADGTQFLLQAPDTLTREQVLQVAGQVTYTP
jgi:hypothetical protein